MKKKFLCSFVFCMLGPMFNEIGCNFIVFLVSLIVDSVVVMIVIDRAGPFNSIDIAYLAVLVVVELKFGKRIMDDPTGIDRFDSIFSPLWVSVQESQVAAALSIDLVQRVQFGTAEAIELLLPIIMLEGTERDDSS
jgi:hypothetical protein